MATKKFQILIFFFLHLYIIQTVSALSFKYPTAFTLTNGNIFVIHSLGIDICNSAFTSSSRKITFEGELTSLDLPKISVSKYSSGEIIIFIINKIYIFDETGENTLISNTLSSINGEYYSLAADEITLESGINKYYFLFSYVQTSDNLLYIYYASIGSNSPTVNTEAYNTEYEYLKSNGLSCEFTKYNGNDFIFCIFYYYDSDNYYSSIQFAFYYINSNNKIVKYKYISFHTITLSYVKSAIKSIDTKPFFCYIYNTGLAECIYYDLSDIFATTKVTYDDKHGKNCLVKPYNLKTYYFSETGEFVFSCLTQDYGIQATIYNKDMSKMQDIEIPSKRVQKIYNECGEFYYSIIYSTIYNKYYIISDINCGKYNQFSALIDEESEENTEETSLEEGNTEESKEEEKKDETKEEETKEESKEEESNEEKSKEEESKEEEKEEEQKEEEKIEEEKKEEKKIEEEKIEEEKIEEEKIEEEKKEEEEIEEAKIEEAKIEEEKKEEEEIEENHTKEELNEKGTETENEICISEKCKECDENSNKLNLCKQCNVEKGYYPINTEQDLIQNEYFDCYDETTVPQGFYLDNENKEYKLCYTSCKACNYRGDGIENNCTSCKNDLILKPDIPHSTNCVQKCEYFYYYQQENYKCTKEDICPENYEIEIKEKKKCIDKCENDNEYKVQYDGECYQEIPEGTTYDSIRNIYKDESINICKLNEKLIKLPLENLTEYEIDKKARLYAQEFDYTNDHVTVYKNDYYSISIYKNAECLSELNLKIDEIDFGNCYIKIFEEQKIKGNFVIVIISKIIDGVYFTMNEFIYNPNTAAKININEICINETLTVQKDLKNQIEKNNNIESLEELANQGIDIFNPESSFYTDLCFHFKSPIDGKDIPVKDRLKLFFPNVTLCDEGCFIKGVNLTSWKAICQCTLNNLVNKNIFGNNIMIQQSIGEVQELLTKTNIEVLTCYKDLKNTELYKNNIGFFIVLGLIIIQILFILLYFIKDKAKIKKYVFGLTDKFLIHMKSQKSKDLSKLNINISKPNPMPKKNSIQNITNENKVIKHQRKVNNQPKTFLKKNGIGKTIRIENIKSSSDNLCIFENEIKQTSNDKYIPVIKNNTFNEIDKNPELIMPNMKNDINIDMNEYMKTDPDTMDYDDAIRMDKRTFCQYFVSKIMSEQLILSTFCNNDILKPKSVKILLLILDIDLYLCINGLFFNENYISEMLESENDTVGSFINRIIDRIFIITFTGVIINYITDFFYVEENKIKKLFKREKDNSLILKYEIIQAVKDVYIRFNIFFIISGVIMIFSLYYVFCFNNVYPSIAFEWIKSSLIIIFVMQIIPILFSFFDTSIRFISFKCKSERLFRLSSILF